MNLHPISFILIIVILSYLITRPFTLSLPEIQSHPSQNEPIYHQILSVLIIAPIVETLIFQVFLFWILRCIPWIRKHDLLMILIAALMFGLYHPFGITYII
ncbi:type II CAAX prenyl endopeptidase Rce1 family protein, partial [Bacillus cereus]|uniref:CPBP family glutamic-type intramembrane protease n=1 Tax=Bacillus cereus TaxID=1396 RepID=UPI0029D41CB0